MTAGQLLLDARHRHGLTQRQLAARARTSQPAISRIERGLVSPTVATLQELLRLMNEALVLDARAVDWGHDVTLNRINLAVDPETRIRRQAQWSRGMRKIRDAGRAARA